MLASSIGVLTIAAPQSVSAQVLPSECIPNPATGGDTINCVGAAIDGIATNVDDLTVNVGDAGTPTAVNELSGAGVTMTGGGSQAFTLNNAASSVTGSDDGVSITLASGAGSLTVNSEGSITGGDNGLSATNLGAGSDTSIVVNDTNGGTYDGVNVDHIGAENLAITSNGTANGGRHGIAVNSYGFGAVDVDAVDAVGGTGAGITVFSGNGGDIEITSTGTASGLTAGVYVRAATDSAGGIDVSVNEVESTNGDGVRVYSNGATPYTTGSTTGVEITASGEISGARGVYAYHRGTGAMSIATADVTGATAHGVYARNGSAAGDLALTSTGTISGANFGVYADNNGNGSLSIDTVDVTGTSTAGIFAYNSSNGTGLSLTSTGSIFGGDNGIVAANEGAGELSIAVMNVTGEAATGVSAVNSANGTDFTFASLGSVDGATQAIALINQGTGALSVEVANAVGASDDAIDAFNSANGTSLSISTAGNIASPNIGINAVNRGSGALMVTAAGTVSGGASAIRAYNYDTGATRITVSGIVSGGSGYGILAASENGSIITLNNGALVSGNSAAIFTPGASLLASEFDELTVNSGATIAGDVLLLGGADTFNAAGGVYTTVLGGTGVDTVNFSGIGQVINGSGGAGDSLREFEIFNFNDGGFELAGAHAGLSQANFFAGENTLSGSLEATTVFIAEGAALNAGDGAIVQGAFVNEGALAIGDSPGVFTVDGDFIQTSSGVLPVEISADTSDLLIVTGDVTLAGGLDVTLTGGLPGGSVSRVIIDGGAGLSGAFDTVSSGLLVSNEVALDPITFDVTLTTTVGSASALSGLSRNQQAVGDNLVTLLSQTDLNDELAVIINAVGVIDDASVLADTLEQLHPEPLDVALRSLTVSQSRFLDLMVDQSRPSYRMRAGQSATSVSDKGVKFWSAVQGFEVDQSGGVEHIDFEGDAVEYAAGVSGIKMGPVYFGFAGGYAEFSGDTGVPFPDDIDVDIFNIGINIHAPLNEDGDQGMRASVDYAFSYAGGEAEIVNRLDDPATQTALVRTADTDLSSLSGSARFTVEGWNGRDWFVTPHARAGFNDLDQDAVQLGTDHPAALTVERVGSTRGEVGVGASVDHQWNNGLSVHGGVTGVQYFGDTQNVFSSRLDAAPNGPSFQTFGKEIERQIEFDASIGFVHESGFSFHAGIFGEAGDLDLIGASATLSKRF